MSWVGFDFVGFDLSLIGFTEFYWVLMSWVGFYLDKLDFIGFYWSFLGFNEFYWVLLE